MVIGSLVAPVEGTEKETSDCGRQVRHKDSLLRNQKSAVGQVQARQDSPVCVSMQTRNELLLVHVGKDDRPPSPTRQPKSENMIRTCSRNANQVGTLRGFQNWRKSMLRIASSAIRQPDPKRQSKCQPTT